MEEPLCQKHGEGEEGGRDGVASRVHKPGVKEAVLDDDLHKKELEPPAGFAYGVHIRKIIPSKLGDNMTSAHFPLFSKIAPFFDKLEHIIHIHYTFQEG